MSAQPAFAVIGHPLGHSMSPFIHRRLFSLLGVDATYAMQDIAPENLATELPALLAKTRGVNVTIPHKQAVIPLMTRLEGRAQIYQSVNTIAVTPDGAVGYNTDADGFRHALQEGGAPLSGRVALLGCGGVGGGSRDGGGAAHLCAAAGAGGGLHDCVAGRAARRV